MKNNMDRVLEMVAAYPAPATDQVINSRLTTIVSDMVDKHVSEALKKQDERLKEIEEAASKQIRNIDGLLMDVAKIHGFEIAERDSRIRDLEHLNLKLITAGATVRSFGKGEPTHEEKRRTAAEVSKVEPYNLMMSNPSGPDSISSSSNCVIYTIVFVTIVWVLVICRLRSYKPTTGIREGFC
ncbi:hypothetical protein LXL04_033799 [Taraxacum kok-saghyz]